MATTAETLAIVRRQLAPSGVLRAAINTANFLLVTSYDDAGLPQGVSPDMAMALAEKISVQCRLIPYKTPSDVADAMATESWDIANIGAEPERAKIIKFSPAYSEIQATYLLPPGSSIEKMNGLYGRVRPEAGVRRDGVSSHEKNVASRCQSHI